MLPLTYGQLPTSAQYLAAWARVIGDPDDEAMHLDLKGTDAACVADAPVYVGAGDYSSQEVWALLRWLADTYELGEECAGDLASSILVVLEIEWI